MASEEELLLIATPEDFDRNDAQQAISCSGGRRALRSSLISTNAKLAEDLRSEIAHPVRYCGISTLHTIECQRDIIDIPESYS